jgi:hypothetical protein
LHTTVGAMRGLTGDMTACEFVLWQAYYHLLDEERKERASLGT